MKVDNSDLSIFCEFSTNGIIKYKHNIEYKNTNSFDSSKKGRSVLMLLCL